MTIWVRHGQPHEQLDRRERNVQEETDPDVRPQPPQELRHQLQLIIVHPDRRTGGSQLGRLLGEPGVDLLIGLPPLAVELRLDDGVVIQRPQGLVREALVVVVDLLGGQCHRVQAQAVGRGRFERHVGGAGPADPGAVPPGQDRSKGGHQAARGLPGLGAAVGHLLHVERQPVGDHHHLHLAAQPAVLGGLGVAGRLFGAVPVRAAVATTVGCSGIVVRGSGLDRFGVDRFGVDRFGVDRFGVDRFGVGSGAHAAHPIVSGNARPRRTAAVERDGG